MVTVYICLPILIMIMGFMIGMPILDPAPKTGRLLPIPEDRALAMLKDDYVNDRLSLEEFDAAVGKALQGQSYQQAAIEANMKTMGMLLPKATTYIGGYCYGCNKPASKGFCYNCDAARAITRSQRKQRLVKGSIEEQKWQLIKASVEELGDW